MKVSLKDVLRELRRRDVRFGGVESVFNLPDRKFEQLVGGTEKILNITLKDLNKIIDGYGRMSAKLDQLSKNTDFGLDCYRWVKLEIEKLVKTRDVLQKVFNSNAGKYGLHK